MHIVALAVAIGPTLAVAEDYPCKPATVPEMGTSNPDVDPSYQVKFQVGSRHISMPFNYSLGRSSAASVNCAPVRDAFDFVFWMPDLRAPRSDPANYPDWRPNEDGHPHSEETDFLVKVTGASQITSSTVSPYTMLNNMTSTAAEHVNIYKDVSGLDRIMFGHQSDKDPRDYVKITEKDQILVTCYPTVISETGCEFTLQMQDMDISLRGYMPEKGINQWRSVILGIKALISKWSH